MRKADEEMLEALRAFVVRTAQDSRNATPAELEAMAEAARAVLGF